jgi:hypothetical protein
MEQMKQAERKSRVDQAYKQFLERKDMEQAVLRKI